MNHSRRWLGGIILLAVALRLLFLSVAGQTLDMRASGYDDYAVSLLEGRGFTRFDDGRPDSDLPPLVPLYLAGLYAVFGRSPMPVALLHIALDIVTLVAIYAIGRRVGGDRVGLLAAAFTGFYPYLIFQNLSVNDTAVFIMLLSTGLWTVYRAAERRSWRWALLGGALLGVAALTKSLVVLMLPLIALWWYRQNGLRPALGQAFALGTAFALVILPWVVRNTMVQGTLTFISTNDGSNLYQGNNPCVTDFMWQGWDAQWVDCLNPTPPGLSQPAESAWFRDQALTWLRENPGQIPELLLAKFVTLWSPELLPRSVPPGASLANDAVLQYETPLFQAARIVHALYFGTLLVLAVVGLGRAARMRQLTQRFGPVLIVIAVITLTYLIYHPSTRYRVSADPFVFVLSACAVVWLSDRALRRPASSSPETLMSN